MEKRNYPKPKRRNIDFNEVGKYLKQIGFESEKIFQEWRHVTAMGKFEGKPAVFKLASTQKVGLLTKNECLWNLYVNQVPVKCRKVLAVPQVYTSGSWNNLFYFISERFVGAPVALDKMDIPVIVSAIYEIEKLPVNMDSDWAKYQENRPKVSIGEKLLESAQEWANQVPHDLTAYLKIIEKSRHQIDTCIGQGDFTLKHLFNLNKKMGVIDGEHAGIRGALYYDLAYLYIRLGSDNQAYEIGEKCLREFRKLLPLAEQNVFWENLKPVIIQRLIGDLWGAANKPYELDRRLEWGKLILEDKIILT